MITIAWNPAAIMFWAAVRMGWLPPLVGEHLQINAVIDLVFKPKQRVRLVARIWCLMRPLNIDPLAAIVALRVRSRSGDSHVHA
jgi:hypothetical protein